VRGATGSVKHPVECAAYLQAKLEELLTLEQVLQGKTLDFRLFCSSLSSVFGGKGRALDAAMSLLIDTFTCSHNQAAQVPWLSVNRVSWPLNTAEAERLMSTIFADPG
jgi:phthiocerol/phenolphthiocerol synthesis type-I polyketide synthase E